ncbi:unnamed protein product [Nesidiocoris tenuis]|uniref:Uncharacterized protein n=1 Tax=Nesidiocoris tenuis TaxID=355587 RepID=A0A6H5GC94_9HEMI|nr:unnamed protein product [Nesidiocoris tenuis]
MRQDKSHSGLNTHNKTRKLKVGSASYVPADYRYPGQPAQVAFLMRDRKPVIYSWCYIAVREYPGAGTALLSVFRCQRTRAFLAL